MMAAILRAVHAALTADAQLTALLGGPHVFEHVPARARPPYVSLAVPVLRDWSTATEGGTEAEVTATAWSEETSAAPAAAIRARIAAALAFGRLAVPGHAVVNVEPLPAALERRPADGLVVAVQRVRIVIEPEE